MITTLVMCDFCDRPVLSRVEIIDGEKCRNVVMHRTKEWDTRTLFPHLCEVCAEKLDLALGKMKAEMTLAHSTAALYAKKNAERRERLGTDG